MTEFYAKIVNSLKTLTILAKSSILTDIWQNPEYASVYYNLTSPNLEFMVLQRQTIIYITVELHSLKNEQSISDKLVYFYYISNLCENRACFINI